MSPRKKAKTAAAPAFTDHEPSDPESLGMKLTAPGGGLQVSVAGITLPPQDPSPRTPGQRGKVKVGGGQPVITATGVTLPHDDNFRPGAAGACVLDLSITPAAKARGGAVLGLIRGAVRECSRGRGTPSDEAIRELGRLVDLFPEIAPRVPELCDYLGWLAAKGFDRAFSRICGKSIRGRHRGSYFYVVELLDRISDREACSIAKAASIAADRFARELSMTAQSLQNAYSKFKPLYSIAKGSQYVDGADLAPDMSFD